MSQRAWIAQMGTEHDEPTMSESARATVYSDERVELPRPTRAEDGPGLERNPAAFVDDAYERFESGRVPSDAMTRRSVTDAIEPHARAPRGNGRTEIDSNELASIFAPSTGDVNDVSTGELLLTGEIDPKEAVTKDVEPLSEDVAFDEDAGGPEPEVRHASETRPRASRAAPKPRKESVWDAVESRYRDEGHWADLVEMYLQRVEGAREDGEKVALFKKIGDVLRVELEDPQQALDAYVEALLLDPGDAETVGAIESLARTHGWWLELFSNLKRELREVKSRERDVAICELAVRWARLELQQPQRAEPFVERIRKVDPGHPLILLRVAEQHRANGAWEAMRDALERARVRVTRDEERLPIELSLGDVYEQRIGDAARAMEHYDAALAIDPRSMQALRGLERIYRLEDRFADLARVLERQAEVSPDAKARAACLVRVADVHEKLFVRPQNAVPKLEEALRADPKNPDALPALERCYTSLRAWADLVRVLHVRAAQTDSAKEQIAIVSRVAELLELQLGDAEGAAQAWQRVWDLDPANEEALGELARLAERAQDWAAAAAFRAKLADLAPSPEAAARIHVAIGDLLSAEDRDPALARKHFEKAASLHPATPQAWEALEREAKRGGDVKRAAMFLERRAASTESPRLKAQLFVELAQMYEGDAPGAELAYERAIKADPTNEVAADAVLRACLRDKRWADALPLCDLLLAAAGRDGDEARSFALLRIATRIASELGQWDRALTAAAAAWRARESEETASAFVEAAWRNKDDRAKLAKVAPEIDWVSERANELAPALVAKLARVRLAQGAENDALALFSKALTLDAEQKDALAGLAEVTLARGDYERACAFKQKLAHATTEPEEQFKMLVEVGELWAHKAKNLPMAALAFEEALALKPRDSWLLHTLLWNYGELECWEKVVETLAVVAGLYEDPVAKAKSVFAMALVLRDKLHDPARAAQKLEEVLDLDPKRLDAFERVVRVHTELRDWMELKHAYGRMLRRLKTDGDVELRHALFFQLGIIYRDRLGDAARALDSFRAAQRLKPDADDVRRAMIELFVVTDQLPEAVSMVRAALKKKPLDPARYRELYELFLRQRAFDKAWCALDALATLGAPFDAEQARFYQDYPPPTLSHVPGTITVGAWRSHILHPELDPALTKIFALVTPVVLRARSLLLPFAALKRSIGEPLRETNAVAHEIVRTVADGAEILALPAPTLHLREGQPAPLALAPAKNAIFVSLERCESLPSDALAFIVGKRLAEMRPELAARAACPSITELKALVVIAVQLSDERSDGPTTGNPAFDKALVQAITREEQLALRAAINAAKAQGSELDVARWSQLADMSAARVGLLLCGRLEAARRGMMSDAQLAGDLPAKEKLGELLLFAVSDEYAELRFAIGVGVQGHAAA
jgi:tetratricopeptide (TPR) repeat protein